MRTGDGILAGGLFTGSLAIYLQTLAPSVATLFDDSLEFPLASYRLGIVHPTGYPLYTLLSKLFTLGAAQSVAGRVNLFSAVAGALTVSLVFLVARQLTRRRLPATLGALALAVSPLFWSQAVIAEVYTLHTAFVCAIIWVALRWGKNPLAPVAPSLLLQGSYKSGTARLAASKKQDRKTGGAREEDGSRQSSDSGAALRVALTRARRSLSTLQMHGRRIHRGYRRLFPAIPARSRLRPHPLVYALAAVFGLSLTHHRTVLLLAPALLVYVLLVERRVLSRAAMLGPEHPERPRSLQIASRPMVLLALCFLGPLLIYIYLPIRGHVGSLDGTYQNTWSGFWRWVMGSSYSVFLGPNPLARDLEASFYTQLLWNQFGPIGLALALVGFISLLRRPRILALTGLAFLSFAAFAIVYRVPDVEVFFLPAFLLLGVWIGMGLDYAADLLRPRGRSMAQRRLLAAFGSLLLLAAIAQAGLIAARSYPDVDLSQRWIVHDFGSYLLEQPLPPNSTVIGIGGEMTLLRYFQETVGHGTEIETVAADDEVARREAVDGALRDGRTVFLTRSLPGIPADHSLDAVVGVIDVLGHQETLVRVTEPDRQIPDLPRATDTEPVPGLQLLGYGLWEHGEHWQVWARLRLWWRASEGLEEPYKISARLLDAQDRHVSAADAEPVGGIYPTTAWRPGEVVQDAYEIPLPSGLPPGQYRPLVIVYEPDTGSERGRVELAPVHLLGNPARPPRRALEASIDRTLFARLGDVELIGYSRPNSTKAYRPGDLLDLTLLWQAQREPVRDLQLDFWLEGADSVALGTEPTGGGYSSSQWQDQQVVRQWPILQVPTDTPGGTYHLTMRVTHNGRPVPWGRWLIPLGSDLDLGAVRVSD